MTAPLVLCVTMTEVASCWSLLVHHDSLDDNMCDEGVMATKLVDEMFPPAGGDGRRQWTTREEWDVLAAPSTTVVVSPGSVDDDHVPKLADL